MIETNLDSCVEPLHCVGHTKFLDWALVEPFSRIGARRALFEEWVLVEPFWRMSARRALLNVEGQPNLSDLIIISADLLP